LAQTEDEGLMTSEFPIAVLAAMEYSRTWEMGLSQHAGVLYHLMFS
jgi:hypothetical protein